MKNSATDIVIIGAGIAGLAAGCYAQMNGYRSQIFEMHDQPGGLCTAWQRQGFVFDGCIHYIAGEERYEIGVKHYCFDPALAPLGKSVLIVMLTTNYEYWQRIYGRSIYNAEEMQESQILIDVLERFYPGMKNDIEFVDVATPLTYERYTGNWQGSSCGWLLTKQTLPLSIKGVPKTLPKLRNFYAIG
jgi:phytoene dehydrogenase-like protein